MRIIDARSLLSALLPCALLLLAGPARADDAAPEAAPPTDAAPPALAQPFDAAPAALAPPVDAAEPTLAPPVDAATPATVSHWYGGRLLLADGASLAVLVAGGSLGSAPIGVAGFVGLLVASPIVHATHAGLGRGALSLAVRVGLPLAGFLIAKSATDGCWRQPNASDTCDLGAELGATLLGAIAAEVVDVAWLARDSHPVEPTRVDGGHAFAQLVVAPQTGGATMGLAGRF